MSNNKQSRSPFAARLHLAKGFFKFDMKDTLRLAVWIVMAAFVLGGLWAKNKTDLAELHSAGAVTNELIAREGRAREELAKRLSAVDATVAKTQQSDAAIVVSLEGIRTELRYVNEKIDVLRADVRGMRRE